MRRLWAYIIVVFTALVAIFASFPSIIKGVTTNGEFETRRQFTLQLSQREVEDDDEQAKELDENSAKDMAKIIESRLLSYHVSSYDISTEGKDIVTVSFAAESETKYQQIITYLTFSGSFALVNQNDDIVSGETFLRGKAYTKEYALNSYPTVIIPVNTDSEDYKILIQGAKDHPESETSGEGEEATTTETARLYLLYNWQKGETYKTLTAANMLQAKTLLTIDFTPDDEEKGLYYDSNKNSFYRECGFQDKNGNGVADPSEVKEAYGQADYLLNLFSASELDYEVKCIRGLTDDTKVYLSSKVEDVLSNENKIVWNRTLTALIAAIIIVTLLLAFFYKLGAVSALTTTVGSTFLAILVMIKTGLEYNVLAVVALIVVALVSLVSNVIYLNKVKEDCYKGHTLKKANTEASKKSLLPICDVHFVTLIVGVMSYALGGTALRSFAAVLTIGSIISFIINTLLLKGLNWMLFNTTSLTNRYDVFGINPENVPNHMADEKQTFYGAYTDKHFSKHKKSISIVTCVAFLAAIAGTIAASSVRGGNLFRSANSSVTGSEVYIQNRILVSGSDSESPLNETSMQSIMDNILIQKDPKTPIDQSEVVPEGEQPKTYYVLSTIVSDYKTFAIEETKVELEVTKTYRDTYYVISLSKYVNENLNAEIKGYPSVDPQTIPEVLDDYFNVTSTFTTSISNSLDLKKITSLPTKSDINWTKVVLATSIALLIISFYLVLRYRLSRGLASLVFPFVSATITLGLMLLLNLFLNVSLNVMIALPVVAVFSYFFLIQFFNKERELISEDKVKDNSVEHRLELSNRSLGIAYTPILATAVLGIYCLINFFGFGPAVMSNAYVGMFVGSIIALGIMTALSVPACHFLYKLFSKVHINIERKPRKKVKKAAPKSAEPEEAIFIGIND